MSSETATRVVHALVKSELALDEEIAPVITAIEDAVKAHAEFADEGGHPPISSAILERAVMAAYNLRSTLETLL